MDFFEEIKDLLDLDHSRSQCNQIIDFVGNNPIKIAALMQFFFHEEWRYNQRSAWPLGYIGCKKPALIRPYLKAMIDNLDSARHDAVIRNTIRVFEDIEIPEELEGKLFDKCFNYLSDPKRPIAIRAFSMTVLYRIAQKYPDLAPELMAEIHTHMPHGSPGFQSRGRKILAKLEKLVIEENTGFGSSQK